MRRSTELWRMRLRRFNRLVQAALPLIRLGMQRENLARRAQRQLGPIGDCQLSEYTIKIFFYRPLRKAQFVGDLFVGFRLADERYDLLFAERELGVPGRLRDCNGGFAASRAAILSSESWKTLSAAGTATGWRWGQDCSIVFRHKQNCVSS